MHPKSNDWCLSEREEDSQGHREDQPWVAQAEDGGTHPQTEGHQPHQKLGDEKPMVPQHSQRRHALLTA